MINDLLSRATKGQPEPVVGMAATVLSASDRRPATVIDVGLSGQRQMVTVQDDSAILVAGSGHDGSAKWEYFRNTDGVTHVFVFDGVRWRESARDAETGRMRFTNAGRFLRLGVREKYIDPSF